MYRNQDNTKACIKILSWTKTQLNQEMPLPIHDRGVLDNNAGKIPIDFYQQNLDLNYVASAQKNS